MRTVWSWIRQRLIELMSDQGLVAALSNSDPTMLMYAKCSKQNELFVGTVKGVLRAKLEHIANRAVP